MGLPEDIDAIYADQGRTPRQQYIDAATLKVDAMRAALLALTLPQSWSKGTTSVTLWSAVAQGTRLVLVVSATRGGVRVPISNPVLLENPPALIPDPAGSVTRGEGKYRVDLVGTARAILERIVGA